jgi:hypothetical protein
MASASDFQHDRLLKELNEERFAALTRISTTLESLIAELSDRRQRILASPRTARERELAAYGELRARARQYRWYLEVQREALGLRHHGILDEFFEIPDGVEVEASGR